MFRQLFFTDEDVKERLLFDEVKYYDLVSKKFHHGDAVMFVKLANIARLLLKEDAPMNGYARQLFPPLSMPDIHDSGMAPVTVKMLESASYAFLSLT